TTENPYISINPAIRSRTQIFEVHPLNEDDIIQAINRAITDKDDGLGELPLQINDDAMHQLAIATHGDLRSALNALELAAKSTPKNSKGNIVLTLEIIEECMQRKALIQDKDGDAHYDVISALQKSIRGSDVDAALHYAGRLVEAGELQILCRRLMVTAYEDIGLANPSGAQRAVVAVMAAERLGLPEARIPLANAIIELCLSDKSNTAYKAIDEAISDIRSGKSGQIPKHLKDSHYSGAKKLNRGVDYQYPHNFPNAFVKQQYLPDTLKDATYYTPKTNSRFEDALNNQYRKYQK